MAVICFATYEIHPTTAGGCGVLIHHAIADLIARGHQAVLLIDQPLRTFTRFVQNDLPMYAPAGAVRAYRVDDLCDDAAPRPEEVPCAFQRKAARFARALAVLRRRERLDFVEFFEYCGPAAYALAERLFDAAPDGPVLGCRVHGSIEVLERHGDGLIRDEHHLVQHGLERLTLALSETVLAPSRAYVERYYGPLYGLDASRVIVSSPPRQPFPRVARRPAPGEPFTIAFVGRMFHLKGVDQLVHAGVMLMKERPELDFSIDLMGYDSQEGPLGSYAAYLRTLIPARLRDRFVFAGQVSHAEIVRRLGSALFAVFPNRVESFCYALHEVYDAGVPVLINDLPAFADFFTHERNALVYDQTTSGLLAGMRHLIDDPALRERLARPYPVNERPLGDFYDAPRAVTPLAPDPAVAAAPEPTLVVIQCADERVAEAPAVRALAGEPGARIVCLCPAHPESEETLWWLGRAWGVRAPSGEVLEASDLRTAPTLAVLDGLDRPDASWLRGARLALARRASMGFAGTWRVEGGRVRPSVADSAPELLPFAGLGVGGESMPRVVVRVPPGLLLCDLLDPSLGALGLVGLLWSAIARHGPGVLLARPLIATTTPDPAPTPEALRGLLLRYPGPMAPRLATVAGFATSPTQPPARPVGDARFAIAEELGGRLLARMAWNKLARRVLGERENGR